MRLSAYEIGILRALSRGEVPELAPAHRVRLELLGVTRETPAGLELTPLGARSIHLEPTIVHETFEPVERRVDARGRKLASDRTMGRFS
jgi:hypothetical protein